jgi:RNA polymerase-associated protein LEO1
MPSFMAISSHKFDPRDWKIPEKEHHSRESTSDPFKTATSKILWRQSLKDPSMLQSNAKINRWEDGSLTLQFAHDPLTQFEISAKPFVQPKARNPSKPTPTSYKPGPGHPKNKAYDPQQDSNVYVMSPHEDAGILRTTNHITAALAVLPSGDAADDALRTLTAKLAQAVRPEGRDPMSLLSTTEDPDTARRRAEVAEREKNKALRRKENMELKEEARRSGVLKKAGGGRGLGGGLDIGSLESGFSKSRSTPKKHRRNDDYDSEDDAPRGKYSKEDDYDKDDGFVASDEEEEIVEDDDEDELDDDIEEEEERPKKRSSDAGKEKSLSVRTKKRRVIDDEDDDE